MNTIDIKAGLLTCNNNEALLKKLLNKFAIKYDGFDSDILGTCSNEDCQKADAFIHNLKGISGNLGALNLSNLCELFLQLLKNDMSVEYSDEEKTILKKKYQEIKQELALVVIDIKQMQ
ncbi:MAG: hypothetical protein GY951_09390 [Psychromonas sp.]|nr:hypothetical protein [Alteromonadales bacterium]MCP5078252.1 hypothetical protein [Psychromonas sp.]